MTEQQTKLPEGWKWKKLEDLALVSAGNPAPQNENDFDEKGIPFVRVRDLGAIGNSKYVVDVKDSLSLEGSKGLKRFAKGSLLLTKSGASTLLNQRALLKEDCCVVSHIAVAKPSKDVSSEWLYYWFKIVDFAYYAHGANMPSMPLSKIKKINVPFVDSIKQKQIVAKIEELFSHIDAGIESLKTAQEKLKQYRQSVLKAAVTGELTKEWREQNSSSIEPADQLLKRIQTERRQRWEQQKLAEFQAKGKPPKNDKWKEKYKKPKEIEKTIDLSIPEQWCFLTMDSVAEIFLGKMLDKSKHTQGHKKGYLRNVNVRWGWVNEDDILEMFFKDEELERYEVKMGDVLVCEGGEPGRAAVWKNKQATFYQKALHRVRFFSEDFLPDFLVYYLEFLAKTYRLEQFFTGTTIKHFTKESFLGLPMPIPSNDEIEIILEIIEEKLSSADRLMKEIETKLTQAQQQKQTILSSAFCGEL